VVRQAGSESGQARVETRRTRNKQTGKNRSKQTGKNRSLEGRLDNEPVIADVSHVGR
jgi:hypothetical protein